MNEPRAGVRLRSAQKRRHVTKLLVTYGCPSGAALLLLVHPLPLSLSISLSFFHSLARSFGCLLVGRLHACLPTRSVARLIANIYSYLRVVKNLARIAPSRLACFFPSSVFSSTSPVVSAVVEP